MGNDSRSSILCTVLDYKSLDYMHHYTCVRVIVRVNLPALVISSILNSSFANVEISDQMSVRCNVADQYPFKKKIDIIVIKCCAKLTEETFVLILLMIK